MGKTNHRERFSRTAMETAKRDQSNGNAMGRANSESNVLGLLWQRLMQEVLQCDCNAQNLKRRIIK